MESAFHETKWFPTPRAQFLKNVNTETCEEKRIVFVIFGKKDKQIICVKKVKGLGMIVLYPKHC
jgi:hypothetical protein